MRTKIAGRFVVGYAGGDHVIHRNGEVVYEDDRCPIKLHAAQGLAELALMQKWHGKRSIELLGMIGFLGPNVAIGTDMFPPDIIRTLDYGSNMAKQRTGSQTAGAPADLFRAATLGGAKMLGRDDLGRLAPGAKADITVIDLSGLRIGPIEDPIRTLLMNRNGRDVKTVVVDGRTVVEDGTIPGLDVDAMRRRAQAYFERYRAAYSERDYLQRSPDELFPPTFRIVNP